MKTIKYFAPWLAAAAMGAAVALAPIASAATPTATHTTTAPAVTDTDPATPFGTDPESPAIFGYHTWLGDNVDVPF